MGKSANKKPRLPKAQEEESKFDRSPIVLSSDDEADDDLSLKIVQKAMSRARDNNTNAGSSLKPEVIITKVKKKTKKRKKEKIAAQDNGVEDMGIKEQGNEVTLETNPSEKSDNIVLRKLLRGPRYFDPPDNSWGSCYNCGEGGHTAVNCTSAKRKKPCFVCGSFEHNVKQCNKGKDCFICKKSGHRAKDCSEKYSVGSHTAKFCLKCGDSGHEMFSCRSAYSLDDLQEIQCYVCKCFGHLCCVNFAGAGPREVSCYRCGQLGHVGLECARVHAETTNNNGTPSSCYKCGEGGHIARKCTTSAKKEKRKSDFSSPRKSRDFSSPRRDNYGSHVGVRSVPPDLGNGRKRKTQSSHQSNSKPRGRGGWITEDPGHYNSNDRYNNSNDREWGTPSRYNNNRYHSKGRKLQYETSTGSNGYQHRFSASRFGNSSSYGNREYDWY